MVDIKPTKRGLLQIVAGLFAVPFAAKAMAHRRVETGPPYGPHPEDLDPNRPRPARGQVLVTWTSQSGRQFTFDVDRERDKFAPLNALRDRVDV